MAGWHHRFDGCESWTVKKAEHRRKDPDVGRDWRQEEKGTTEDDMVEWHHRLNGHESEGTPGDSEGQGSLLQSIGLQSWT